MKINNLLRKHLQNFKPYSSARDEFKGQAEIYLDANENNLLVNNGYHRYPDPLQWQLKHKIAAYKKIDVQTLFLGNGSDEPIDLLIRAFCEPREERILVMPPTYGMYTCAADLNNVQQLEVPLTSTFDLDVPAILNAIQPHTKIIFICSPNNPSGNSLDAESVRTILKNFSGLVVVDEAYIDFSAQESWSQKVLEYPNLVVLQTFSKAWGLAGLRLGMAIAQPEIIQILNAIKPPYNINLATQQLVMEKLNEYAEVEKVIEQIIQQRHWLSAELEKLEAVIQVYPSDANFILVKIKQARKIYQQLCEKGIIVRDRSNVTGCESCLRISIGTAEENQILIETLKQLQYA